MDPDPVLRSCSHCGATAPAAPGGLPEGWSSVAERGRVDHQCAACVRANIRSIEAKLPGEHWER